jgi:hypothetical protein
MELVGASCYLEGLRKTKKPTPSLANVPAEIHNVLLQRYALTCLVGCK